MTRENGPKFSEKHGTDAQADPRAKDKIEKIAKNGEVACAVAFQVAGAMRNFHQFACHFSIYASFFFNNQCFNFCIRVIEFHAAETLFG